MGVFLSRKGLQGIFYFSFRWFIMIAMAMVFACASKTGDLKNPEFRFEKATIARGVSESGSMSTASSPTKVFSTQDKTVVSLLEYANLSQEHLFRWEWYRPDGRQYLVTRNYPVKAASGKYIEKGTIFHQIAVKDEKASNFPGSWQVKVYVDQSLVDTQSFELKPADSLYAIPQGLPPILSIQEISFSDGLLDAGETEELSITLKNSGLGVAKDVYLELFSTTQGLVFEYRNPVPVIPKKGGIATVKVPVSGNMELLTDKAFLDVQVVEPHFRVKIKGKRLAFQTRKFRNPELILAKFAAVEGESSSRNQKIDINEIIDVKFAVQNVGQGEADRVKVDIENDQAGVMFLGVGQGEVLTRDKPEFAKLDAGKYEVINYRYFVNSDFTDPEIVFKIKAEEKLNKYGFAQVKKVAINTTLKPEGFIRKVAVNQDMSATGVTISDIPDFVADVDLNIPVSNTHNPDAVAVVIGNRNYTNPDVPSVQYAINDAQIMKQYLIKTLGVKEGNIIFETDATKTKFEALFGIQGNHRGLLNDYVKPGKSDVYVYYSGHGAPDTNTGKAFFVPVNCDPAKIQLTGYPLDIFYENLSKLEARNTMVIMDACFSGGTGEGRSIVQNASPVLLTVSNAALAHGNLCVLASSDSSQISSWYNEKQHGLFTYFFLKALRGEADQNRNKQISVNEVYNYVADKAEGVPYWARRLHGGRVQTPVLFGGDKTKVLVQY